jgi:hypothetical protein
VSYSTPTSSICKPIYLYVTSGDGHGIGSSLSVRLDQNADWLSFLIDQLGMKWAP